MKDIVTRTYIKHGMFKAVKAAQKIGWNDEQIKGWIREINKAETGRLLK